MIKFAPTYPASETFDLKLGGVLWIAGSILRTGSTPGVVFAVSAPEGLHRYLYRVPVPSCRQFDAWVAKEYPLSAAAQRLSRSNLRLDLQQSLTLLFQQRRWLGQARYPASSG